MIRHWLRNALLVGTLLWGSPYSNAGLMSDTPVAPIEAVGTWWPLPAKALDAAVVPETGVVATVSPDANVVMLYPDLVANIGPGSTPPAGTRPAVPHKKIEVGAGPVAVRFKQVQNKSYLLVLCREGRCLNVLDAKSFAPVEKVALPESEPLALGVPQDPAVPYVYCLTGPLTNRTIRRVNLQSWKDEGEITIDSPAPTPIRDLQVAADGRWIYAASAVRLRILEMVPSSKGGLLTAHEAQCTELSLRFFLPDVVGHALALGNQVWLPSDGG